jgi:hypothetical protein
MIETRLKDQGLKRKIHWNDRTNMKFDIISIEENLKQNKWNTVFCLEKGRIIFEHSKDSSIVLSLKSTKI